MLKKAIVDKALSSGCIFERSKGFFKVWQGVEDDDCSGRPETVKTEGIVQKMMKMVRKERCLNIRIMTEMVDMNTE